jgi:hypothetical protein
MATSKTDTAGAAETSATQETTAPASQDATSPERDSAHPSLAGSGAADEGKAKLEDAIRLRAYEISQSGESGSPEQNWERAAQELSTANW